MTGRHPAAVGTYGPEMVSWAQSRRLQPRRSAETRWWQRLVTSRALEHDVDGHLVWSTVIVSGPRQVGKSWAERMVCGWRIHQGERFGEEQALLHVAHKLVAAQEVWRPAARWAAGAGARVRWANGEQQIELEDGSRWMIQAANDGAGVAFGLSMVLVDEAWRVPRQVVDEALEPTLAESVSPQLWLVSTAGTAESDLMLSNRAAAIAQLDDPGATLLVEWSAPPDPDLDIDDPVVWRSATPHWDERREARMTQARARSSERAFRQQWLNQWVPSVSRPLLGEDTWSRVVTAAGPGDPVSFGVEVAADRSAACIVAVGGGVVELVAYQDSAGWLVPRVLELAEVHAAVAVGVAGSGPARSVVEELQRQLGERLVVLSGPQLAAASGQMFDRLTCSPPGVRMRSEPTLAAAVAGAGRHGYGQTWGWSRDAAGMVLTAASAAVWASEHVVVTEAPMVFS